MNSITMYQNNPQAAIMPITAAVAFRVCFMRRKIVGLNGWELRIIARSYRA